MSVPVVPIHLPVQDIEQARQDATTRGEPGRSSSRILFDERWAASGSALDDPGNRRRVEAIAAICPQVDSLLDVGCGGGDVLRAISGTGKARRRVGCDTSYAGLHALASEPGPGPGVAGVQATADRLPFADRSFELVSSCDVLEHLPDRVLYKAVRELMRVSARYVLINVPLCEDLGWSQIRCPACHHIYHRDHHQRCFTRQRVEELLPAVDFRLIASITTGWTVRHPVPLPAELGAALRLGHDDSARCERCGARPGALSRGRRLIRDGFVFLHNALTRPVARYVSRDSEIVALFSRR